MNYDDKQPMHNGSEIGLVDMGLIDSTEPKEYRNLSRKQLIDRIMKLEKKKEKDAAFNFLLRIKHPISFTQCFELAKRFNLTSGQCKKLIISLHGTKRHKEATKTATHLYGLDGEIVGEMTEKLRADILSATDR